MDTSILRNPSRVCGVMKAVIVMLQGSEADERLQETMSLCKTVGYDIEAVFTQKGRRSRKYLIRKGKVQEIREFVKDKDPNILIFENLLTSRQALALESIIKIPVIDRFDLILNVFETHSSNKEAALQIELARLKKKMPYIKMYLSRRVMAEHPGFGGSGEFIINSTLTTIHRKIKSIERALDKFEKRTDIQRSRRKKIGRVVSLAGYTNVGKTSLLYALTGVKKPAKDELFTTLQTKTANYRYSQHTYLVNDTIGFIRNIPYQLIYAFKATLRDIANSDLILIVHDATLEKNEFLRRKEICEETLMNIGATRAKWLNVLNKVDVGKRNLSKAVRVSAVTGEGIDSLKEEIHRLFEHDK
jgi:GTP-binding protein HflX